MNAGTGKIKVVSAARAGVPRATLSAADTVRCAYFFSSSVWRCLWLCQWLFLLA